MGLQKDLTRQEHITHAVTEKNEQIANELEKMKKQLEQFQIFAAFVEEVGLTDDLIKQIGSGNVTRESLVIRGSDDKSKERKTVIYGYSGSLLTMKSLNTTVGRIKVTSHFLQNHEIVS